MDLTQPPSHPHPLFRAWYEDAKNCDQIKYAHAMCLATIDADGLPDARTVLLKHLEEDGLVFFTDSRSPKALALEHKPEAALVFYWGPRDRQVRFRGRVEKASDEISDLCFRKRPRGSQIAAWASPQSETFAHREELDRRVEQSTKEFEDQEMVSRPPFWQAYRLVPRAVEFWRARAQRLHDRLLYTREEDGLWRTNWLYP